MKTAHHSYPIWSFFFLDRIPKNAQILIFIIIIIIIIINCKWVVTRWQWLFHMYTKYDIRPVGAELFHTGGKTDRQDRRILRFPQIYERT